jgi:spermidine synthase
LLPFSPAPAQRADAVFTAESPYNLIRVLKTGRWSFLLLNDERFAQSVRHESGWTRRYHDVYALGPLLTTGRRALVLGMGAGSSIISARLTAPDLDVDAIEIDPKVVEASVRYFGIRPGANLRIHSADARLWLTRYNGSPFDIVQVDLFQGGPYVPFYLTTVEFFGETRRVMSPESVLMLNVFDPTAGRRLLHETAATLRRVFPALYVLTDETSSHMLLAFPAPVALEQVRERLASAAAYARAASTVRTASSKIKPLVPPPGTEIYTDDHAPVEQRIRAMLAEWNVIAAGQTSAKAR